jgi:type I restriction enzyme R subunit
LVSKLNKTTLSESDICDKFIRPAMEQAGWNGMDQIYREFPLRAGRVSVRGNKSHRDQSTVLRADYALLASASRHAQGWSKTNSGGVDRK